MTSNNYKAAEIVVLGNAEDFIHGCIKGILFDDAPGQERRTLVTDDVE
jgi:hypothetical protein